MAASGSDSVPYILYIYIIIYKAKARQFWHEQLTPRARRVVNAAIFYRLYASGSGYDYHMPMSMPQLCL